MSRSAGPTAGGPPLQLAATAAASRRTKACTRLNGAGIGGCQTGKHLLVVSISAFDPTEASASVSFCRSEPGFCPYQSTRLSRYDAVS